MSWRKRLSPALALLPWLGVVAFGLWAAAPILQADGEVFAGRLSTDNVVTPWFYDLVARLLADGRDTDWLIGLRHPSPLARTVEFPSDWDARLLAPLSWWAEWPRSWGLIQTAALLVNGLGAAILARGLGARGPGIVVAGILGVVCRPVWKDLIMARMNAAFPGLAVGALGAWLWTVRTKGSGLGTAALAVGLGVAATLVYPPYVALLVPFGVLFGWGPVWKAKGSARLRALAVVGLVAVLTVPALQDIAASGMRKAVACSNITCPTAQNAVSWDRIFLSAPDWREGLSLPGSVAAALWLWPLALWARPRRAVVGASVLIGGLLFLSLGPCASWSATQRVDLAALPFGWDRWVAYILCKLEPIHDYNRLLTLGVTLAGVLGGVGVHALAGHPRRSWLRWLAVVGVAGAAVGQAQWVVLSESLSPTKWHRADPPATARHIADTPVADRGLVLELPFDRSAQFLSILAEPSVPRGNPLRPGDRPPMQDTFWRWAYAVGKGQSVEAEPLPAAVKASGVRWVYFDEDRCANAAQTACTASTHATLRRVLGAPKRVGGLLVWKVER